MRHRRPRPRVSVGVAVWLLAAFMAVQGHATGSGQTDQGGDRLDEASLKDTITGPRVDASSTRLQPIALSKRSTGQHPTDREGLQAPGGVDNTQALRRRQRDLQDSDTLAGDGNMTDPIMGVTKIASTNPPGMMPKYHLSSELELALVNQLKQLKTNTNVKHLNNTIKLSKDKNRWEKPKGLETTPFSPLSLNFDIQNLTDKFPKRKLLLPTLETTASPLPSKSNQFSTNPGVNNGQDDSADNDSGINVEPTYPGIFNGTIINNLPYRKLNSSLVPLTPPIPASSPSTNDHSQSSSQIVPSLISFLSDIHSASGDTVDDSVSDLGEGILLHVFRNEVQINNLGNDTIKTTADSTSGIELDTREKSADNSETDQERVTQSGLDSNLTSKIENVENVTVVDDYAIVKNITNVTNTANGDAINAEELSEIFEILKTVDWHGVHEKLLHGDLQHEHETANLTVHDFSANHNNNINDLDDFPETDNDGKDCENLDQFSLLDPSIGNNRTNSAASAQTGGSNTGVAANEINSILDDGSHISNSVQMAPQENQLHGSSSLREIAEQSAIPSLSKTGPAPSRRCLDAHGRRRGHPSDMVARSLPFSPRHPVKRHGIIRRQGASKSPLEVLFSINDQFLPVPIMRSTPPKNDLLSHLISATNPIPYAMESYNGVRNMFTQKMKPVMNFYNNMNIPIRPALRNIMPPVFRESSNALPPSQSFVQRPTQQFINTPLPLQPVGNFQPFINGPPFTTSIPQSNLPAPIPFEPFPPNAIVSKTLESETSKPIVTQLENFDIIHTTVTSTPAPLTTSPTVRQNDRIINIKIPTSTGKNPIFEINLMADGNIGILPVSDSNVKREVPLISLQSMISAAEAAATKEQQQQQQPEVTETPKLSSFQQEDTQHLSNLLNALPPVPRTEVSPPFHLIPPTHPVPPPVASSFNSHGSFSPDTPSPSKTIFSTNNWHVTAPTNSRLHNGILLNNAFVQRTIASYEPTSNSYDLNSTPTSEGQIDPKDNVKELRFPQIKYQTDPFLFGIKGLNNNYEHFNAPYSTSFPDIFSTTASPSQNTVGSISSSVPKENAPKSSFGSDPNVYYIDITIPESKGGAPLVEHGKGGHLRPKRDADNTEPTLNRTGTDDRMTRLIQYTGWHPVDLSNPLNNEPTVSYKPPPLQKVHFGEDPPATKPLYPIVPENPTVYVVRKDRAEPEIDRVYGTEKIEYLHIEPKSKTIRAFQPAGNARIVKYVKRLDSVKPSEQSKRSHNDPNDYFLPPVNGPNFDISNLNFNISDYPNSPPDLDLSFTENRPSVSQPFLRILPPGAFRSNAPNVANARGILPTTITPQQLLEARLNLARLPLMSPLHGLFGSFTQIPFEKLSKSAGSGVGDRVVKEVSAPALSTEPADHMEQQPSESVRTVLFARSRQNIDRSDSVDYFDDEEEFDRIRIVPSKTRFGHSRYKPKKQSKTIAANSLSELLQIFKYTNATEPPPLPTTTPAPVTIMKGFRYTKPTEAPPTTTTTRPTTTKRFRLPTAFRYSVTNKPKSYIENTLTTTEKPVVASRITIAPTLTPKASKRITGIPDLIFDRVAETNSLDGYLFSDSEASPEYKKAEVKPNVIQKINENVITPLAVPKALSSKRVSIRLIGEDKAKEEIVHDTNAQPLKSEFEIIYTTLGKTTSFKPETKMDSPFTITQGHSKVSVFRPNNTLRVSTSTPSPLSTFPNVLLSPVRHPSLRTSHSTLDHSAAPQHTSTSHSSGTENSPVESSSKSVDSERFAYYDPNYESYDYYHDATNVRESQDYPELASYDEPSYLIRRPWLQRVDPSSHPAQVSLTRLPPPGLVASGSESSDRFLEPLPHEPPPPPLHFLEGLRRAMPTSAVPTTWQDFYTGTPEESATKEPANLVGSAPDDLVSDVKKSDAVKFVGEGKSLTDVKESQAALETQSDDDSTQHILDSITASSLDDGSQPDVDRMTPGDRIADEVKAAIIESIVTDPFETERQPDQDHETEGPST